MNIMADLSKIWGAKRKISPAMSDDPVANPLPYFEEAFLYVRYLIVQTYISRNCTYAEFLEEVRKVNPGIVTSYFELFDAVDCEVYGKWCSGTLTIGEFDIFCRKVDEWKEITLQMIRMIERRP